MLKSAPVLLPLEDEGRLLVRAEAGPEESVLLSLQDPGPAASGPPGRASILRFLETAFTRFPEARELELAPDLAATLCAEDDDIPLLPAKGRGRGEAAGICRRAMFYQRRTPWLRGRPASRFPLAPTPGPHGRPHPIRPPQPEGLVYERFDPQLGMTVSFRSIDPDRDLARFHAWMNDGRVAFFWELAKPEPELARYLEDLRNDPHAFGLIGCFDGDPAGYFEAYWAKEDRLGAHYEAEDYDRGWHGLIGNPKHLGRAKTLAWLRSLTHYLFLDDIRTRKVVGEPNAAHKKLLRYADAVAYYKVKEFDFPHKRAALMHCDREAFFDRVRL